MSKLTWALASLSALLASSAIAVEDQSYQHEIDLSYAASTEAYSDGAISGGYRYYFSAIEQASVPYELAGFLGQTSNFGLRYNTANDDFGVDSWHLDGEYVFANKWFIAASYDQAEIDNEFLKSDTDAYSLSLGYYFNETSSVYARYMRSDSKGTTIGFDGAELSPWTTDNENNHYALGVRSFTPLQSTSGLYWSAEYTYSSQDMSRRADQNTTVDSSVDSHNIVLSADWYVTRSWSIGAMYDYMDADNISEDSYGLSTAYYLRLTDALSLKAQATKYIEPDVDGFYTLVELNARF